MNTEKWFQIAQHLNQMNTSVVKALKGETLEKDIMSSYWKNIFRDQLKELNEFMKDLS